MNETQLMVGYVAGTIAFLQAAPYIISILRRHTKPERATYAIWSLVNILTIISYVAVGACETILVGIAMMASSIIVFLLSFKYGMGGLSRFDLVCLVLAVMGVVLWLQTDDVALALYFYIGVKLLGF